MDTVGCPACGEPLDLSAPWPIDHRCPRCERQLTVNPLRRLSAYRRGQILGTVVALVLTLLCWGPVFFGMVYLLTWYLETGG